MNVMQATQPATPVAHRPTEFQSRLAVHAAAAADWLLRSIDACGGNGSSAYYSRAFKPTSGWAPAYPETTGYIIETLFDYARFSRDDRYAQVALRQADWVISLQEADGALPGGWISGPVKPPPSIFNTGQMIFGLVAAFEHTRQQRYLDSAHAAARWLALGVDDREGLWTRHAYIGGYSPAYYTRVCWPMLEVWQRTRDDAIRTQAVRVLDTILGWQQPNGAVKNWGFKPGAPAFTHTIAYTMRGFQESGRVLGGDGERFDQAGIRIGEAMRRSLELRGRLAGAYDLDLKGRFWYTCLTGNCQLALNWMRLCERWDDRRLLSAALKALEFVMLRQSLTSANPARRGAIAGSAPLWGRYLTLRYPNWAAKFFLDACLIAHRHLSRLLESLA